MQNLRTESASASQVGKRRTRNEDAHLLDAALGVFAVADGIGGNAGGREASKLVVESLAEFFRATQDDPERTWPYKSYVSLAYEEFRFLTGIRLANLRVFEAGRCDARYRGMGSTLVAAYVVAEGYYLGNVGDSRAYRVRGSEIELLTVDHTLVQEYRSLGTMSEEDIQKACAGKMNVLLRAMGMREYAAPDVKYLQAMVGDTLVLCSDGLTKVASDADIWKVVTETEDSYEVAANLIGLAASRGSPDDTTCVTVRWFEETCAARR